MHRQHDRLPRQLDDGNEILQGIETYLEHVGGACKLVGRNEHRVSVRRAPGRGFEPDISAGA